ncbi:MAG: hypothetical protein HY812_00840 [Planctomycetes bacterium]|nr:hypothetical protein [Planctomycetota bacterium]
MVFRWFRKNKQFTRWMYILVTVFVMVTFTVTGAMLQGLSDESDEVVVGSFETPGGRTVMVRAEEYGRLARQLARLESSRVKDERVWEFLMLDALADEAGIVAGDDLLAEAMRQTFPFKSDDQYRQWLRNAQMEPRDLEEYVRQTTRQEMYKALVDEAPRLLSERIVSHFQKAHEQFKVDYVEFSDAAEAALLDQDSLSEEQLREFYDKDMNRVARGNKFSSPEKYTLDAALLGVEGADAAKLREVLDEGKRQVSDEELQAFLDENAERFPAQAAEPAPEGAAAEGGEDGGAEEAANAGEEEAEKPRTRPLAEVRDVIEREILVRRVIDQAAAEYRSGLDRRKAEAPAPPQGEGAAESPDETAAPAAGAEEEAAGGEPPADLLAAIAGKYGLELVDFGAAKEAQEIAKLERIGSEELVRAVPFLGLDQARSGYPTADLPWGFLLRLKGKTAAQLKSFEEVRAELPAAWLEETAQKQAEEKAQKLCDAIRTAARQPVADEIAKLEEQARAFAQERIDKEGVSDEAEREKIVAAELEGVRTRIEDLARPYEGECFAAVAKEQGLAPRTIDFFRKSYLQTEFYRDEEQSPEKFLKGHAPLFEVPVNGVLGPLRDSADKCSIVALVVERRFPGVGEMRLYDRQEAQWTCLSESDPNMMLRMRYRGQRGNPEFEYPALRQKLRLKVVEQEAPAQEPREPGG